MRAASGKFTGALASLRKDKAQDGREVSPNTNEGFRQGHPDRSANGSGSASGGDFGKIIKSKVAHTTLIPAIGNQNLRQLQDLITSEKGILQGHERLANDISKGSNALAVWGASEGSDLSDVLNHASSILNHLSDAMNKYAEHEAQIRALFKSIRTREEELEELTKRRKRLGVRAENEERKLAKMGQENKNLPSQTELLESLRQSMRQMDTEILTEEAKVGDFKRRTTKEALALKFGGCLEMAEKATIVGELGKLLTEEIPIEETPVGYGRPPYTGFEQTWRLSAEAARCIGEVSFNPAPVLGMPSTQGQGGSVHTPSFNNLNPEQADDYRRYAQAYGDDPETPNMASSPNAGRGYTADELSPAAPGTHYAYNAVTGTYDLEGHGHQPQTPGDRNVVFDAPAMSPGAPAVMRDLSFGGPLIPPGLVEGLTVGESQAGPSAVEETEKHGYEYAQARADAQTAVIPTGVLPVPERQSSAAALDSTAAWQSDKHLDAQQTSGAALTSPVDSEGTGLSYLAEHESPTPAHGSASKIMDRGRMVSRASGDFKDGTIGGFNIVSDNSKYYARNHPSSPTELPAHEESLPLPSQSTTSVDTAAAAKREVQRERETFGMSDDAAPRPLPPVTIPPPIGQRTVSASAFNRGRNKASSPVAEAVPTFAPAETLPLRTNKRDSLGNTSGGSLPGSARASLDQVRTGQVPHPPPMTAEEINQISPVNKIPPPTYGVAHLDSAVSDDERDLR